MSKNGHGGLEWVAAALNRFEGRLLRYAQRITGDPHRARDVVQETFLKLCRENAAAMDGHLAQWLYTVCRNQALDVRRKEARMSAVAESRLIEPDSPDPAPDRAAEDRESAHRILDCLDTLTSNQQECIRLKFQHGLSYREISAITGLTVTNVGFVIHTGLKKVREKLARGQSDD